MAALGYDAPIPCSAVDWTQDMYLHSDGPPTVGTVGKPTAIVNEHHCIALLYKKAQLTQRERATAVHVWSD